MNLGICVKMDQRIGCVDITILIDLCMDLCECDQNIF